MSSTTTQPRPAQPQQQPETISPALWQVTRAACSLLLATLVATGAPDRAKAEAARHATANLPLPTTWNDFIGQEVRSYWYGNPDGSGCRMEVSQRERGFLAWVITDNGGPAGFGFSPDEHTATELANQQAPVRCAY